MFKEHVNNNNGNGNNFVNNDIYKIYMYTNIRAFCLIYTTIQEEHLAYLRLILTLKFRTNYFVLYQGKH